MSQHKAATRVIWVPELLLLAADFARWQVVGTAIHEEHRVVRKHLHLSRDIFLATDSLDFEPYDPLLEHLRPPSRVIVRVRLIAVGLKRSACRQAVAMRANCSTASSPNTTPDVVQGKRQPQE